MWKTAGQVAQIHGVSRMTINNWVRQGKFAKTRRTKGGHYRIWVESPGKRYGYARVSSSKQAKSLQNQKDALEKAYPGIEIFADIGSGFNFKRPGFRALLEQSLSGAAVEIVVPTRDRLARVGLPFIVWAVELHGGTVTALEETDSEEEFDVSELVGFITSFIASYHGKRSTSRRRKKS